MQWTTSGDSFIRRAISAPMIACEPSTSCVTPLPMSGDSAPRLALVRPRALGTEDRVRTLHLVRHRLADVVEQRPALGDRRVDPELGRDRRGDVRRLDEMLEDVLTVRGPELQPPEQPDHLGVHVGDPGVEHRLLAGSLDLLVDLLLRSVERLLDPRRKS